MDNFIKDLDELYKQKKKENKIKANNREYSIFDYITIKRDNAHSTKFLIKKGGFTNFLYCKKEARVHFTDADILTMLLQIEDKNIVDKILESFRALYGEKGVEYEISVGERKYSIIGISYIECTNEFTNIKDISISFDELFDLINIILAKDKASVPLSKEQKQFQKRTLVKYIVLLEYYYNKSNEAKKYLQKKGYNLEKSIYENFPDSKTTRKRDTMFYDFKLFESLHLM